MLPPAYDSRRKKARILLHLADTLIFEIINAPPEDATILISNYTALGDLNVLRSSASAPLCSNTQLFDPSMLVKHLAGIRDGKDTKDIVNTYCGRVSHNTMELDAILDHALDPSYWDRTRLFFSNPNILP